MKLAAHFVVPVGAPAIKNGAVCIEGGLIRAVGKASEVSGAPVIDYGDAVICPGFINAHTHLELSCLAGQVAVTTSFADWLHRLRAATLSSGESEDRVREAMELGISQLIVGGSTAVGDISKHPEWSREALASSPFRAVSFGEVIAIGTIRHRLHERLEAAATSIYGSPRFRAGISPHAPYTVEPDGLRTCAHRAQSFHLPLCIHLAETAEEETFTRSRQGPFAEFLKIVGIWDEAIPTSGCGPVELALTCGLLGPRTLLAHANYVSDADIGRVARSGASVAYCPRTHAAFGHGPHRFRDMRAAGINVCIGTDSLASSPSLSMLDEIRFLSRRNPDVDSDMLLAMATINGARALGFAETTGSIAIGKSADLVVLRSDESPTGNRWDPFLHGTCPPLEVYIGGIQQLSVRTRFRRGW